MGKLKNPLIVYIGFAIFFVAGMFLLVMGFISVAGRAKYVKTEATVIAVEKYEDDEGDRLGRTTYEYYVDGVRYEKRASYSQSLNLCPMVGDTITIRYDKNNPSEINDSPAILTVMFFVMGSVFAGVGGSMFVLSATGKMHWVSANGERRAQRRARKAATDSESRYDASENTTYTSSGDVVEAERKARERNDVPKSPFDE